MVLERKIFYNVCMRDCYDTCSIKTEIVKGKLSVSSGDKCPLTGGFLCFKGQHLPEWFHSDKRLKTPLVRKSGRLVPVNWDEALKQVSEKIFSIVKKGDNEKILLYQYAGDRGVVNYHFPMRLFHRLEASFLDYGVCDRAGQEALKKLYGTAVGYSPEEAVNENLLVYWGMNPVWTNLHGFVYMKKHKLELWAVEVRKSETAKKVDHHFILKPGSDFLFAILISKMMVDRGWYDKNFVKNYVEDFEDFKSFLKSFSYELLEYVGISYDELEFFAKNFYEKRGIVHIGYGFQRSFSGGYGVYFVGILPVLTGHKCGFIYDMKVLDKKYAERPDLRKGRIKKIPQMKISEYVESGEIEFIYIYNANPLNTHQNVNRLKEAFKKTFVVVHDIFLTETAKEADVVFPANTFFERLDVVDSYYHNYILLNEPVKTLHGISNRELTVKLARVLGYEDEALFEPEEEIIKKLLEMNGYNPEELFLNGYIKGKKIQQLKPKIKLSAFSVERVHALVEELKKREKAFKLITPGHYKTITSQYYNIFGRFEPFIHINPNDAEKLNVKDGDRIRVYNEYGSVVGVVKVTDEVGNGRVLIYKGSWNEEGSFSVNVLIGDDVQEDFGNASVFHGFLVHIEKF